MLLLNNYLATCKTLVGFCSARLALAELLAGKYRERESEKETNHSYPLRLGPRHRVHLDPSIAMLQVPFRVLDHSRPAQASTFEAVGLDAPFV